MSMLYKGNYYKRFEPVFKQITGEKLTEICFGDTVIAAYCKKKEIAWLGLDINPHFVENALKKGFIAQLTDVASMAKFPKADVCIISGSLYHFHENLESLFIKMLAAAPQVIISEPVINLSSNKGIIGKLAKASANVNGKTQSFRFTEKTLLAALDELSKKLNFEYSITDRIDKDIIIVIKK
ncbi:hypothetical protein BH10BAC1_BH10BAC1_10710 [soil metagenome]